MNSTVSAQSEHFFSDNDIIVSKTNLKGHITYANDVFLNISGYREDEILGMPHSIIRHPDMPRAIFKLMWNTIQEGREIFAYSKNRTKDGGFYWVLAHVTPSHDRQGNIQGFHSNRRVPDRDIVMEKITPLYATLCAAENRHANARKGLAASWRLLNTYLNDLGIAYDEFIHTL